MPFLSIHDEQYFRGSYFRSDFRGYQYYDTYRYKEIEASCAGSILHFTDHLFLALCCEYHIPHDVYHRYMTAAKQALADKTLWDCSNEEIYDQIHQLRMTYLSASVAADFRRRLAICSENVETPFYNGINQSALFQKIFHQKSVVLLTVSEIPLLPLAATMVEACLLAEKMVFLLVKSDSRSFSPTEEDWKSTLASLHPSVKRQMATSDIRFLHESTLGNSIDFSRIPMHSELDRLIQEQRVFLISYGEDAFLSIRNLRIPAFSHTTNRSLYSKAVQGMFSDGKTSLVYIPPGYNIFQTVPIVEKTQLDYSTLAAISREHGENIYGEPLSVLKYRYPTYFCVTDNNDFQQNIEETDGESIFKKFYYDYTRHQSAELVQNCVEFQNKVLISVVLVSTIKSAEVLQIQSYNGLSFREYFESDKTAKDGGIFSNFMFYTTTPIIDRYNQMRIDRPREQINIGCIHMDYYMNITGGSRIETFPLYNKGCIAYKKNEDFDFFNFQLGAGQVRVNSQVIQWERENVNCDEITDVHVFTPFLSKHEDPINHWEYRKVVGENALNLVIIGNTIVCMRWGDVLMPSLGVVISLEVKRGEAFVNALCLKADPQGYFNIDNLNLEITLAPAEGISAERWAEYQWIYGGGMTLLDQRDAHSHSPDSVEDYLHRQGWLCPLSKQTQESDTYNATSRHPRTVMGLTTTNKFFICILSGRTKTSAGATYQEIREVIRHYLGEVHYLLNVDGGASSFLGILSQGKFREKAYPCASDHTCTGMERKVSSLLRLYM